MPTQVGGVTGLMCRAGRPADGCLGTNALPEKKVSAFEMFGKFFWGPMPWMIEAAAIMSILVKDLVDFIIIMVMLLFNAVLGFWHERQAASALDALNRDSPDESQTDINVRVFPALLQDRREVLTANSTSGNPNAWSRV